MIIPICFTDKNCNMYQEVDFFKNLPQEIVEYILQFLDMTSINNCLTVTKKWRNIILSIDLESKMHCKWLFGKPRIIKRREPYKTPENVFKYYISPDIEVTIEKNLVKIYDKTFNKKYEEIEDSEERGNFFTSGCQRTTRLICLLFKKKHVVTVLIIERSHPEIRKCFTMNDSSLFFARGSTALG